MLIFRVAQIFSSVHLSYLLSVFSIRLSYPSLLSVSPIRLSYSSLSFVSLICLSYPSLLPVSPIPVYLSLFHIFFPYHVFFPTPFHLSFSYRYRIFFLTLCFISPFNFVFPVLINFFLLYPLTFFSSSFIWLILFRNAGPYLLLIKCENVK